MFYVTGDIRLTHFLIDFIPVSKCGSLAKWCSCNSEFSCLVVCVKVVLVRWNEPFQKLATCDTDGGIFVWIQYEGRWSVELVNDRGAQVGYTMGQFPGHRISLVLV